MEATNFRQVRPEDFDVRQLRKLAREGRLYYDANEPTPELIDEDRQQSVLQYVCEIDEYVTAAYEPYISLIWKRIVTDQRLSQRLFITKGPNQGELNRYRVLAIVVVLLESGVYAKDKYNLLELHHRLEHTKSKDCVYTNRANYALDFPEIRYLQKVIKEISSIEVV